MAAAAAATTPDAVAGAVWQDLNAQSPMPAPGGLSLKLSNEKQCVLNCPHGDSQPLGMWVLDHVQSLIFIHHPPPRLFFFLVSMIVLTPYEEALGY